MTSPSPRSPKYNPRSMGGSHGVLHHRSYCVDDLCWLHDLRYPRSVPHLSMAPREPA